MMMVAGVLVALAFLVIVLLALGILVHQKLLQKRQRVVGATWDESQTPKRQDGPSQGTNTKGVMVDLEKGTGPTQGKVMLSKSTDTSLDSGMDSQLRSHGEVLHCPGFAERSSFEDTMDTTMDSLIPREQRSRMHWDQEDRKTVINLGRGSLLKTSIAESFNTSGSFALEQEVGVKEITYRLDTTQESARPRAKTSGGQVFNSGDPEVQRGRVKEGRLCSLTARSGKVKVTEAKRDLPKWKISRFDPIGHKPLTSTPLKVTGNIGHRTSVSEKDTTTTTTIPQRLLARDLFELRSKRVEKMEQAKSTSVSATEQRQQQQPLDVNQLLPLTLTRIEQNSVSNYWFRLNQSGHSKLGQQTVESQSEASGHVALQSESYHPKEGIDAQLSETTNLSRKTGSLDAGEDQFKSNTPHQQYVSVVYVGN